MLEAKEAECSRLRKLVKTSRVRHEIAETRQEQVKSALEHIENTVQRHRPKKSEVTRRSMGDLKQLIEPFGMRLGPVSFKSAGQSSQVKPVKA
jgi:hypothetical protein